MIALNELIENFEEYKEKYTFLKQEENLNLILDLENERKQMQLEFEQIKSQTNTMCHELAIKKANNENTKKLYSAILINEKQLKFYERELGIFNKKINEKLKKLPNLPDEILWSNEEISVSKKCDKTFKQMLDELKSNFYFLDFNLADNAIAKVVEANPNERLTSRTILRAIANYVFEDNNIFIESPNRVVLLLPHENVDEIVNWLILFLKNHSKSLTRLKTKIIRKSSCDEYSSQLNENENVNVEIKREFYTRHFNIKYKSTVEDMTRFFNEVDILF